jgi:AraC-like DNA-binding protein
VPPVFPAVDHSISLPLHSLCQLGKFHFSGKSPMAYLLEERLNYSRALFYDRDLTIGEIAERSGFNDPLYFSRQFHRHFGASPTVFRKKLFEVLAKPSVKVSAPDEKDV